MYLHAMLVGGRVAYLPCGSAPSLLLVTLVAAPQALLLWQGHAGRVEAKIRKQRPQPQIANNADMAKISRDRRGKRADWVISWLGIRWCVADARARAAFPWAMLTYHCSW